MSQLDELIAESLIGDEAEKFFDSDLGRAMIGMAEQQVREAQEAFVEMDPENILGIRELQNRAKLGRMFKSYLIELISNGRQATEIYAKERKID